MGLRSISLSRKVRFLGLITVFSGFAFNSILYADFPIILRPNHFVVAQLDTFKKIADKLKNQVQANSKSDRPKQEWDGEVVAKKTEQRLEKIAEVKGAIALAAGGNPDVKIDRSPRIDGLIDGAHYGIFYSERGINRFLALHVALVNLTDQPVVLKKEQLLILHDGKEFPVKKIDNPQLRSQSVNHAGTSRQLADITDWEQVTLPAQGTSEFWVAVGSISEDVVPPSVTLKINLPGKPLEFDCKAHQRAILGLKVESLGPHDCLRRLSIHGPLNSYNFGSLVDVLAEIQQRRIARVIVMWQKTDLASDGQVENWIYSASQSFGQNMGFNQQYPSFPSDIRELHVVTRDRKPRPNFSNRGPNRVHDNEVEAVGAALQSAFLSLSASEVLQYALQGPAAVRAAALVHGSCRLDSSHVNQLIRLTEDEEPLVRQAAASALGNIGDQACVEKLVQLAQQEKDAKLSEAAIGAMADSRFAGPREAMKALLANADERMRNAVFTVLADTPRSEWSETLFQLISQSSGPINQKGFDALLRVGHPRLQELLERGLRESDRNVQLKMFDVLAQRRDEESSQRALEFALEELKKGPPTGTVLQVLTRNPDPKAIPFLIGHLKTQKSNRVQLINLLVRFDTPEVQQAIYDLKSSSADEQSARLRTLCMLQHPRRAELLKESLYGDRNVAFLAADLLSQDGSDESVDLLMDAFLKRLAQKDEQTATRIANSLSNCGSPETRTALILVRDNEATTERMKKSLQAVLTNMRYRSPAFQKANAARQLLLKNRVTDAERLANDASKLDPDLLDVRIVRGDLLMKKDKFELALVEFQRASQLDPADHYVFTAGCICKAIVGDAAEALKELESGRKKNGTDPTFLYNCACCYGRALQRAQRESQSADRDQRGKAYRDHAMADLNAAFKHGFRQPSILRTDKDLDSLRKDPEFVQLINEKSPPGKKSEDEDEE